MSQNHDAAGTSRWARTIQRGGPKLDRSYNLRMSKDDFEALRQAAERYGYIEVAPYIRWAVLEHAAGRMLHLDEALRNAGREAAAIIGAVAGSLVAEAERKYLEGA